MSKIYLATDHAGFELKEQVKNWLTEKGEYEVTDCGAESHVDGDDYPRYISKAAKAVQADSMHAPAMAIIFGGSGTGEAIVANRFHHIRAAIYAGGNLELVKLSREHNDANVLSIGARFVTFDEAKAAIELFLSTHFSHEERHADRILQIEEVSSN
jgi:ribose 5-phosphate isomerase B